jgi:3-methyladenine DNA glycosylase Tag
LLPKFKSAKVLAQITDDRADMTKRIFSAGFCLERDREEMAGLRGGFVPKRLQAQPDEFWERLAGDARIVRNAQKSCGARQLAEWPATDQIG